MSTDGDRQGNRDDENPFQVLPGTSAVHGTETAYLFIKIPSDLGLAEAQGIALSAMKTLLSHPSLTLESLGSSWEEIDGQVYLRTWPSSHKGAEAMTGRIAGRMGELLATVSEPV